MGCDKSQAVKEEEWRAFQTTSLKIDPRSEFKARVGPTPTGVTDWVGRVLLVERLREVRALRGFTRIDPVPDIGDLDEIEAVRAGLAPIRRVVTAWLPGVEFRGEGILLQLEEDKLRSWEDIVGTKQLQETLQRANRAWHAERGLQVHVERTPRFVLLHTLSHLVIRQLALECGYSSASLRERIYSTQPGSSPMAGILIYTATPDAEGSLGGLVDQGRPESLGPLIGRAILDAALCANDPLCADRLIGEGGHINGAACHACLLVSETACECGNHYLDRGALVPTVSETSCAFFAG
jgi:MrfA Zn-binding domain